jgi:hypothetical protein
VKKDLNLIFFLTIMLNRNIKSIVAGSIILKNNIFQSNINLTITILITEITIKIIACLIYLPYFVDV